MSTFTRIPVSELPIGMVIGTGGISSTHNDAMTVTKVTYHKKMGTVHVEGTDTKTGEPMTLRFSDGIEFIV